jgi:hypothetical protein
MVGCSIIFVFVLTKVEPSHHYFLLISGGTNRCCAHVVNEMAALETVKGRHEGRGDDFNFSAIDYVYEIKNSDDKKNNIKNRYDENAFMFVVIPMIIFILLVAVRGWSNIKNNVKEISRSSSNRLVKNEELVNKTKLYIGKHTFSYGIIFKKVIFGTDYLLASEPVKKFMLFHELSHLKFRDSVLKNFIINFRKFFLPIFLILFWFHVFFSGMSSVLFEHLRSQGDEPPDLSKVQLYLLISYAVFPVFMIFIIYFSFKNLEKWFAHAKEFLADKYAYVKSAGFAPEIKFKTDKYHPSGDQRLAALNSKTDFKVLNGNAYLFCATMLLNMNFSTSVITEFEYYSIFSILIFLL